MLENLTGRARRTLFFARYEAAQAGAIAIGSEHLLLGLLRESDEAVEYLLARLHVDPDALRAQLMPSRSAPGGQPASELPLADDGRRALLLAAHEAEILGQPSVGNEHVLLGMLRLEACPAARALAAQDVTLPSAREELAGLAREREAKKGKRDFSMLDVAPEAVEWLLAHAIGEQAAGARPLRRVVQRFLRDAVSDYLISHRETGEGSSRTQVEDGRLVVAAAEGVCAP